MKRDFRGTTPPRRRQMSVLGSKGNTSFMISPIAMKNQAQKNKKVKEYKRLSTSMRKGICIRKDQTPYPSCINLNQTGREGQKVLDHLELTTGLTNKYLFKDIYHTFQKEAGERTHSCVPVYTEKAFMKRKLSQFINKQSLI